MSVVGRLIIVNADSHLEAVTKTGGVQAQAVIVVGDFEQKTLDWVSSRIRTNPCEFFKTPLTKPKDRS